MTFALQTGQGGQSVPAKENAEESEECSDSEELAMHPQSPGLNPPPEMAAGALRGLRADFGMKLQRGSGRPPCVRFRVGEFFLYFSYSVQVRYFLTVWEVQVAYIHYIGFSGIQYEFIHWKA